VADDSESFLYDCNYYGGPVVGEAAGHIEAGVISMPLVAVGTELAAADQLMPAEKAFEAAHATYWDVHDAVEPAAEHGWATVCDNLNNVFGDPGAPPQPNWDIGGSSGHDGYDVASTVDSSASSGHDSGSAGHDSSSAGVDGGL